MESRENPKLSLPELAALVVLMAEDRELSNPEMNELVGFTLTGTARTNLVKAGFIESRKGAKGAFFHSLTESGWAQCRRLAAVPRPAGPKSAVGALMALLGGVQRGLDQRRISHGDFFGRAADAATDTPAAVIAGTQASTVTEPSASTEGLASRIRAAYAGLAVHPGDFVTLADLRDQLGGVERGHFDTALRQLSREGDVHVMPTANLKALDARERGAALHLGGEDCHILVIEKP
jgi:hypothetical protein